MDDADRQEILARLEAGGRLLMDCVAGLPDAAATRRPVSDRWSVLEVVEHVAVTEGLLLVLVSRLRYAAPEPEDNRKRESQILRFGTDRTRRFEAPEIARPTGRYPNVAAAMAAFHANRAETVAWVETCRDDLRTLSAVHPVFGPRTCRQILEMMAVHPGRHAGQILEVRQALPTTT